jgi:creatinine amidohydrolase/Fe(II)-dependent formamide hydrolase-like protein
MSNQMRELAEVALTGLPEHPLVLVPVGSTEQHGPHLPLQTDTVVATAVARALAERLDGYVAPAVSIGASGEHHGFPGVLSIGTPALHLVIVELVRSLSL